MNKNHRAFIAFLGLSGAVILLSAFFLTLFGFLDLRYANDFQLHGSIDFFGNFFLFCINIVFVIKTVFVKRARQKDICILLAILLFANWFIKNSLIVSTAIPFVAITIIFCKKKNDIINLIVWFVLTGFLQYALKFVKTNIFDFEYHTENFITTFVYNIDLILIYILIERMSRSYEEYRKIVLAGFSRKHLVLREKTGVRINDGIGEKVLETEKLTKKQKIIFAILSQGYQVFQLAVVLAIGLVNNMFLELIAMLIMFWVGRGLLKQSWHSNKLWICSCSTFIGFYVLTKITPPFSISLFMTVVCTGSFVYILHVLGIKSDRLEELEKRYETDFTKYGLSLEMAKFAHDWKIEGLTDKELMHKYEIMSRNTLNSRKRRIKDAMDT